VVGGTSGTVVGGTSGTEVGVAAWPHAETIRTTRTNIEMKVHRFFI
jgi:hypothetical protein